jgi:hypothetical protein
MHPLLQMYRESQAQPSQLSANAQMQLQSTLLAPSEWFHSLQVLGTPHWTAHGGSDPCDDRVAWTRTLYAVFAVT